MRRAAFFDLGGRSGGPDLVAPVKGAIWLYFWLLLGEGVLRKWVLPGLSDALLLVRDPVVVVAYVLALRAGVLPWRPALAVLAGLTLASLLFSVAADAPILVVLFGLRTDFLHLPLVFVMAAVMDRDDVVRIGRWTMILALPIGLLMLAQFRAAPDSWLNVGAGGGEAGQLRGAMGRIRPPGPFSFISGPVSFYALVAAYACHGWLTRTNHPRWLLWVASITTVVAVPVSISRSLLLGVLIVLAFAGLAALRQFQRLPRIAGPLLVAAAGLALISNTVYVQAFVTRWDEAAEAGGGSVYSNVVLRFVGLFTQPFELAGQVPLFGHGIGMGTLAGARLATGQTMFLLSESELGRVILESGPLLGFVFIAWRVWLAGTLLAGGWRCLLGDGDALAWMLAGASFYNVIVGQWGQTTQLGFAVFGAGLALAAMNGDTSASPEPEAAPTPVWGPPRPRLR